jgi:hypothetical protein
MITEPYQSGNFPLKRSKAPRFSLKSDQGSPVPETTGHPSFRGSIPGLSFPCQRFTVAGEKSGRKVSPPFRFSG